MATLTNTQINALVNSAYQQMTGQEEVEAALDLTALVDKGTNSIADMREQFTKALLAVIVKNWFTDSSYRSSYNDPYFEDAERFGAITQMISVQAPEVRENSAWKNFESGVTQVGQYTVYLPIVDTKYYAKSTSWALPITITNEQWDTAVRNESELRQFVSYVFVAVDNAIVQHMKDMNYENRNNFIAEKIQYAASTGAEGIHVINLVEEYAKEVDATKSMTVAQANADTGYWHKVAGTLMDYVAYFGEQTALFNTEGKVKFTPRDRIVLEVLQSFQTDIETKSYSNTYHDEFVKIPNHVTTAWWQAPGDMSFDARSSINVKTGSGNLQKSGIVALLADKWAIIHTIKSNRVAVEYKDIEALTLYEYQHRDQYMNNLGMNAIVFVEADYTAPTPPAEE